MSGRVDRFTLFNREISGPQSQSVAPLWDELRRYAGNPLLPFHTPGHKRGNAWGDGWDEPGLLAGIDLSEIPALRWAESWEEAEALAARFFQAEHTFFLVQGASQGIMASLLGAFAPGDTLLVSRNCHISVIHGIILAGSKPVFIANEFLPGWGLAVGLALNSLRSRLREYPEAKGLLITNPTYQGIAQPVAQYREIIGDQRLLIVDEAHGGHFGWMGYDGFDAFSQADLWIHGTHKSLGSLTQTGMLHLAGDRVAPERIRRALRMISTTSPSYVLLASLDANRRFLAETGRQLFQRLERIRALRNRLASLGVALIEIPPALNGAAWVADPWRICLSFQMCGSTGFAAAAAYRELYRIQPEYADLEQVTFFISPWQDESCLELLYKATATLWRQFTNNRSPAPERTENLFPNVLPRVVLQPREAALGPIREVPFAAAVGKIVAAVVAPYPPGVPLLVPGEMIGDAEIQMITGQLEHGGEVRGVRAGMIPVCDR